MNSDRLTINNEKRIEISNHELLIRKSFLSFTRTASLYILIIFILLSCSKTDSSRAELALGTVCSVTLFEEGKTSVYEEIFTRINTIEILMSVNIPSSDISRINAAAGIESVQVHEDTFKVIERAVFFAEFSGGAFDPTVGPLVSLWGIGTRDHQLPAQDEIEKILPLVNWRNIELDTETHSVFLKLPGMARDLGAIAKGYAADEAAYIIRKAEIERAKIDFGGDIILIGIKEDKSLWRVGIQNPGLSKGNILGILQMQEKTVVTSGVYERYFIKDEKRYHHIFDPFTGYPAESGLLSVTVISDISMDADALSTAIFVLGYEKGMDLLTVFPGAEAIFVFEDKSVRVTAGVDFKLTDESYWIAE